MFEVSGTMWYNLLMFWLMAKVSGYLKIGSLVIEVPSSLKYTSKPAKEVTV